MKLSSPGFKKNVIDVICILYILLFVYAAVSKLLDFENFQVQLGQSPLLYFFAGEISWLVPMTEILIAFLLVIPKIRFYALAAAFTLMITFTAYIFFILNYSSSVPCSCGGILEKMGWKEHFVFNIVFIILAGIGILICTVIEERTNNFGQLAASLSALSIFGIGAVGILYAISENRNYHRSNFTRMFPPAAVKKQNILDLKYNSYYFAGISDNTVYLGNTTSPALLLSTNPVFNKTTSRYISIKEKGITFRAVQLRVQPPYFYVLDGSVPCIFRGSIANWKADLKMKGEGKFSNAEIIDSTSVAFRANSRNTGENILGKIEYASNPQVSYHPELLKKQMDGIFDTDGMLKYSTQLKKMVYIYFYRNQFIIADDQLRFLYEGKTIDNISIARLKIASIKSRDIKKLAEPAVMVNKTIAIHRNLLFINSGVLGKYERKIMWKQASIIDVYNLENRKYLMSFYIYNEKGKELKSFIVNDNFMFAIIGNSIVSYRLGKRLKKEMNFINQT
jgi:uncharacterized membrane protein YphA (DoxX/SURF4 family)